MKSFGFVNYLVYILVSIDDLEMQLSETEKVQIIRNQKGNTYLAQIQNHLHAR